MPRSRRSKGADPRVDLIEHERNQGVGAAIVTGYKRAIAEEIEVTAVMAADGQMDPDDLEALVQGVIADQVDYAKANRLFTGQAWELIPRTRYLGNAVLSFLTKIASGYWHVADSQSGYTAVNLATLKLLDLDRIYKRYGFPNDLLVHLNVWNRRVRDYPSRPIYGVGERSGIRLRHVVPKISWLLTKGFFWRMKEKYIIRDFHPLVLFYSLGMLLFGAGFAARLARGRPPHRGESDHERLDRPRRPARHLGAPAPALRHVVRHGVEQGPPLRREQIGRSPGRTRHDHSRTTQFSRPRSARPSRSPSRPAEAKAPR